MLLEKIFDRKARLSKYSLVYANIPDMVEPMAMIYRYLFDVMVKGVDIHV